VSELQRILKMTEAALEDAEEEAEAGNDSDAAKLSELAAELDFIVRRYDHMCRCITGGYRQGVFDFSRAKEWAFEFTGLPQTGSTST